MAKDREAGLRPLAAEPASNGTSQGGLERTVCGLPEELAVQSGRRAQFGSCGKSIHGSSPAELATVDQFGI